MSLLRGQHRRGGYGAGSIDEALFAAAVDAYIRNGERLYLFYIEVGQILSSVRVLSHGVIFERQVWHTDEIEIGLILT